MVFNPDEHYAVVTKQATRFTGVGERSVLNRVIACHEDQEQCDDWNGQPTTIIDDGRVEWTVTISDRMAPDGVKRMAFIIDGNRYDADPVRREVPA